MKKLNLAPCSSLLLSLMLSEGCSQPPILPAHKLVSSDATPENPSTEDNKADPKDQSGDETKTEDGTDDKGIDKDKDKDLGADKGKEEMPAPLPEAPKFVPCTEQAEKCHPHQMILADLGMARLLYVNLDDPTKDWDTDIPGGVRDVQLIGDNKVLVGTIENSGGPYGWHEIDIATGKIVKSVTGLTGPVMSVQRLANGHTLLIGDSLLGGKGAVIVETNDKKEVLSKRELPGQNFRTVRRSRDGHFFIGNGSNMIEYTVEGKEVWRADVGSQPAYMGLKLPSGERVVASGHGGKVFTYDAAMGKLKSTITLPDIDSTKQLPAFASAFAILPNGNYVTTNWAGGSKTHGKDGPQVAEYTPEGKLVWSWAQDAKRISSVYAVLVLDNLDLSKAHDDTAGPLAPVTLAYP
ncbi:MAG: hypothetical protein EOP10_07390 [Proteobacteria bacterium]|nr:MAG: hypothetical protein EOP10_07390 [Pseudomonadota bacterium]